MNPTLVPPVPDGASATAYWSTEAGIVVSRCQRCQQLSHPPQDLCPQCWSPAAPEVLPGTGVVAAVSVIHHSRAPGFSDATPYVVAIVRIEEGIHVHATVTGVPPEQVSVGLAVAAVPAPVGDAHVPVFEAVGP